MSTAWVRILNTASLAASNCGNTIDRLISGPVPRRRRAARRAEPGCAWFGGDRRQGASLMNPEVPSRRRFVGVRLLVGLLLIGVVIAPIVIRYSRGSDAPRPDKRARLAYREKAPLDAGGFTAVLPTLKPWPPSASLEEIARSFERRRLSAHRPARPGPGAGADARRPEDGPATHEGGAVQLRRGADPGLSGPGANPVLDRGQVRPGSAVAIQHHLLPGGHRAASRRE